MTENQLSYEIIGAAIEVHRILGPGLLESAYEECLCYELRQRGFHVEQQLWLPMRYKEVIVKEKMCSWFRGVIVFLSLRYLCALASLRENSPRVFA